LTLSGAQNRGYSEAEFFPGSYDSTILKQFVETLEGWKQVEILDVGPVCRENLIFFARRVPRHHACDMFIRLHRALGKQRDFCRELDYPPRSFDGIQLWDLLDHLDDHQARQLLKRCLEMLKATGLLMLVALEKKPEPETINTFIVGRNYRIDHRKQAHLKLPWYCRHNRAMLSLLAEFNTVKLFRYRNGVREFLFKKPGLVRD
jgi:hypothetical protein